MAVRSDTRPPRAAKTWGGFVVSGFCHVFGIRGKRQSIFCVSFCGRECDNLAPKIV